MRIGMITGEYPPMQGGVGDYTRELARALLVLGHEVHVITDVRCTEERPSSQIAVHPVSADWGWRSCWNIKALTDQLDLDLVNMQYQAAAYDLHPAINFFPLMSRRPVVVTFHDLKEPYFFPKAGPLRTWVVSLLARRADTAVVTNRADELELISRRVRRVERIPIGSNITPTLPAGYDRDAWRAKMHIGPEDFLLGFFGFFNSRKGVDTLIRATATLDPFHQILFIGGTVGSSDVTNRAYADRMVALAEELGLGERVHFTGYVPAAEVSAAFAALDLCVLPYADGISFHHGTLIAALAHSQSIVSTLPRIGIPELIHGENVWLVPRKDVSALADAIATLAANPIRRRHLARGATRLSAQFMWEHIAERMAGLFESVQR